MRLKADRVPCQLPQAATLACDPVWAEKWLEAFNQRTDGVNEIQWAKKHLLSQFFAVDGHEFERIVCIDPKLKWGWPNTPNLEDGSWLPTTLDRSVFPAQCHKKINLGEHPWANHSPTTSQEPEPDASEAEPD